LTKQYSILLGDNPFFGVSHLSQEISRQKAAKSQNFNNILDVMNSSFNLGINKMVVSTHPQLNNLIQHIKNNSQLIDKFEFYPILPYAQGYVSKVNEMGMINALKDILKSASFQNKISIIAKGGLGALRKDFFKLFKVLIDIELLKLQDSKINTVFLHDVLTDLALSLGMKKVFQTFQEHIHEKHKAKSGPPMSIGTPVFSVCLKIVISFFSNSGTDDFKETLMKSWLTVNLPLFPITSMFISGRR